MTNRKFILLMLGISITLILLLLGACVPVGEPITPSEPIAPSPSKTGEIHINHAILVKGNNEPIVLVDNPAAQNVTYQTLKTFLHNDTTDEHPYILAFTTNDPIDVDYVCSDFAELLHNNAEATGIRAGLVYVDLPDYSDHVMNAFETIDQGLVFIDSTGQFWLHTVTLPWMVSFGEPKSWDKVAYLEKGKSIGFIEVSVAELYGFTYESYNKWQEDKANFDRLFDSYGDEITWEQEQKLKELADKLGGFFEQEDIAGDFQIFWEGIK